MNHETSGAQLLDPASIDITTTAVFLDIDGTLAPVVAEPADAAVDADVLEAVRSLVDAAPAVGIVTGRTLEDATRLVPVDGLWVAAAHGMHLRTPDGDEDECDVATAARLQLVDALTLARTVGWRHEDKGHSITVHFRHAATPELTARGMRAQMSTVLDPRVLAVHDARMALEIRPVGARTKEWAVRHVLERVGRRATGAVYVGDDTTDLDGFAALEYAGAALRVAVASEETPRALIEAADYVLSSQEQVFSFLTGLVGGR